MVVPGDGFANSCEGARVHGTEMDHLSCYMTVIIFGTSEGCPEGMVRLLGVKEKEFMVC